MIENRRMFNIVLRIKGHALVDYSLQINSDQGIISDPGKPI